MSFWETESEKAEREHNEGEKEGANADLLDRMVHAAISPLLSDAHNKGYDNGVANPARDDDD